MQRQSTEHPEVGAVIVYVKNTTRKQMETESKFTNVKMVRVEGDTLPLVEVEFNVKDGKKKGLMLLDSCGVHSMVFDEVVRNIPSENIREDMVVNVNGMAGASCNDHCAEVEFSLGGKIFRDVMISDSRPYLAMVEDDPILGILGNVFFRENDLVIDYSDFTLHTSVVDQGNILLEDYSFFFPMSSIKYYGVPVVVISNKGKDAVALVDSGSTENVITEYALCNLGLPYEVTEELVILDGISSAEHANVAMASVKIASMKDYKVMDYILRRLRFAVIHEECVLRGNTWIDDKDEQIPDVEAIIGGPMMAKEGWVLDFGAMIIYKKK